MKDFSYALGINIAANLKEAGIDNIDTERFAQAVKDALSNGKTEMTQDMAQNKIQEYFAKLQAERGKKNIEEGKKFLEDNAKREGVVTLPSGLQYEILTAADGKKPSASDSVKCHYHGTLIDGTVFDSSVRRNQPATFGVSQVIQGWVEALQLMPVGSKWRLFIPYNLAYGERGAGSIPPYATLIFDVELLDIV
ncbi:MAG: FKBP-type peptidyl-prolyl cis-trans isomerase [Paludibacteraceae bacterium]|jgi:FKBP-type peptidyl-prolyl cis-trans isomerase FklB|nr:FKBP-type peptidyl-prolyl cis-trans isomerase [Paludibacteraceae bacterium]MDD6357792.1 FKBP-type peptidyl-prolyl cis-trans isomerase [Bacteroidales bacterium]